MSQLVGTPQNPLRVAVIGAGPSGFYTAGELLRAKDLAITVDMFERLPTPHGLVRYGVAPDHQKIKAVSKIFERTADNPRFRFFGHVNFGTDITLADLRTQYDQIVFAVGAQADRRLNIPGEDLSGSLSATEFVAWYNGHPDYVDLPVNLDVTGVVVVGVGNVAMDVARVLAKSVDELKETDIADHALAALAQSKVRDIYVVARRGPAQAKFTPPEFKEFGEILNLDVIVDPADLVLDPASAKTVSQDSVIQRNLEHLRDFAAQPHREHAKRRVHFLFLRSPVEITGDDGCVTAVLMEKNRLEATASGYLNAVGTGQFETLSAGMVLRAIGYRGVALPDIPFDERRGIIPNKAGRVLDATGSHIEGLYVAGWAKRGPTGVIGTNKPDAAETVANMLADLPMIVPAPQRTPDAVPQMLTARGVHFVSLADWRTLDAREVHTGESQGRPRVKFTSIGEMLAVAQVQQPA